MKKSFSLAEAKKAMHAHVDMRMGEVRKKMIKEMVVEGQKALQARPVIRVKSSKTSHHTKEYTF